MMRLPDEGEVSLRDALVWGQEQAEFLTPTQAHLLLVLTANAWCIPDNPEGLLTGDVLSGLCSLPRLQHRTGLGRRTVQDALAALQDQGYLVARMVPGNGQSRITVFWGGTYDDMRAEVRSGARRLPKAFRKAEKKATKRPLEVVQTDNVIQLPLRQEPH